MLAYLLLQDHSIVVSEALVARASTAPARGCDRRTAATRAFLAAAKAVSMSGIQGRVLGYLRVQR